MAQSQVHTSGSESLQQTLRLSQRARALGRYNEATVILDDYFSENTWACSGITPAIEFTLNYLAQGYLTRAHEVLLLGFDPRGLMRDVRDPELALFDLLIAAVQFRYGDPTTIDTCDMKCLLVWKDHLEGLELGGHTETHVKLEILIHETRHYIALQRRESSGRISASIMMRLIMICNQLCAEGRHSEALELARLRKRLWPSIYYGIQSSDQLSLEEAVSLCCVGCMLDIVENVCGGAGHFHAHIDMHTIQFHSLLSQTSTTAEELDQEATRLVSCYEDVDFPGGAVFVLQLLLTWKSKHGIPFLPIHVELARSFESQTGELLPLVELDSIHPPQHFGGTQCTPRTNTVIREGLTNHMAHSASQAPQVEVAADRIPAHSRAMASHKSSSTRPRNPFSRLVRFIKGDFSEERLSASGPLSTVETVLLAGGVLRSLRRCEWQEPGTRRKLQVLRERMPHDLPQRQTLLAVTRMLEDDDDPVHAIEEAEATLRACSNEPLPECWAAVFASHVALGKAHHRLRNLDKAMHHFGRAKAAAAHSPLDASRLIHMVETLQFLFESKKEFQPGRRIDDLPIESTRQKALQLLQTSHSDQEKKLISGLLQAINPDDSHVFPEMARNQGSLWELFAALSQATGRTNTTAEFDILRSKLRMFEELREKDQTPAKSLAYAASVGYFILGYTLTAEALEYDPPLINLVHEARLCHQAALGALEYGGAANSRRYAECLWAVGRTWIHEGIISKDPVAYQLAFQELRAAEEMLHETRSLQEPTADGTLDKLIAKQQLAGQYDTVRILGEVFLCCWLGASYARNETQQSSFFQQAWELIQRQKARGLLDVMSTDASIPVSILQVLRKHPEQNALLQEESRLMATLSCELSVVDRTAIRNSLQSLRMKMKQYPILEIAMRARDGEGFKTEDLYFLSAQISHIGSRVVFVDWFTHLDLIFLFTATSTGLRFQIFCHRLSISESTVSAWARSNLKTHVLADNDDAYYRLRELKELIAPLKSATMPGDILILCPTATLYHIPLHALEIDGTQILLERNPVAYIPSLSILRYQLDVIKNTRNMSSLQPWRASIMSIYEDSGPQNPSHEVAAVRGCLSDLAFALGTTVQNGPHVDVSFFRDYVSGADLIHFHGHSIPGSAAENQALVLQPSTSPSSNMEHHLTARRIFTSFTLDRNPLVVNMACASGSQEIKPGDEPFGLTTAFLFAGAKTVIGTLWPLKSSDGRNFTTHFYEEMRKQTRGATRGTIVNVAEAVQKAALRIRDIDATEAPYHWASFVVCGLWEYPFGGEFSQETSNRTV